MVKIYKPAIETKPKKPNVKLAKPTNPNKNPKPQISRVTEVQKKRARVVDEDQSEAEDVAKEEEEGSDDEDEEFHGFSTEDDDDSSDEEDFTAELPPVIKKKLSAIPKDEDRGVIYLGRIPHGFYEDQMKAYFTQFGDVTRLRLSRNKRTGRSKHYAYIEFDSAAVAEIVADTMHNYLLMGHLLTCKVIPKDEVHPELWIGANRKWRPVPTARVASVKHNKPRTEEEQQKAESRLIKRQAQKKRKLEQVGIKYDFEAVAYKRPKPVST